RYGEVQATDAFSATPLRSVPQLRVGVSLESGLLELSVLTKDMSYEDLLAVLQSYRQKKRYHRLSDGALVDLAGENQLGELERMAEDLDVRLEELLNRKKPIPAYRALYLDNLLEQHDALAANRDRAYRGLLKSFKTIRDADYEVPEAQAEILRPYQVYGYKWLRTLTAAGFGGVLADEMGLGKTVQAIALLQALRDAGEEGADLVVSPASLVFNWQEEFSRFAPGLEVAVLAGPPAARRKLLREKAEEGNNVL
ncbi:MAG: SNF2 helicase associated domain-containing protein, partial [bacterium]